MSNPAVSMPFKRAGWLQRQDVTAADLVAKFQCPLSGLVGCNALAVGTIASYRQ